MATSDYPVSRRVDDFLLEVGCCTEALLWVLQQDQDSKACSVAFDYVLRLEDALKQADALVGSVRAVEQFGRSSGSAVQASEAAG